MKCIRERSREVRYKKKRILVERKLAHENSNRITQDCLANIEKTINFFSEKRVQARSKKISEHCYTVEHLSKKFDTLLVYRYQGILE